MRTTPAAALSTAPARLSENCQAKSFIVPPSFIAGRVDLGEEGPHRPNGQEEARPSGRSEGDQPQSDGLDDRLAAALHAELAEDGIDVELDRVVADAQPLGDPLVGEPLTEELQHLALPRGEVLDEVRRRWGSVAEEGGHEGLV